MSLSMEQAAGGGSSLPQPMVGQEEVKEVVGGVVSRGGAGLGVQVAPRFTTQPWTP